MLRFKNMINKFLKKQDDNKNTINPVVVEAAGMAAVAGIEIALALRNKKTRKKITKVLMNAKNQAMNYVNDLEVQKIETEPTKKRNKSKIL